jgi:two-component system, cell cycle response regulator DivK
MSRVLIIDDDNKNIYALTATLKSRDFSTISALSARDGIELLAKDPAIKVVLMDMMMPDMDGYEALREIKGDNKFKDLPVIAVTAQAMYGDREKCLAAGADHYIPKPINVDHLLVILHKYVKN